jgi:hypothetical protein
VSFHDREPFNSVLAAKKQYLCADRDTTLRAKLLERFTFRWFTSADAESAEAAAGELCRMLALVIAEKPALLPLAHDEPLVQLLTAILHGSEAVKVETGRKSVVGLAKVQQVRRVQNGLFASAHGSVSNSLLAVLRELLGGGACRCAAGAARVATMPASAALLQRASQPSVHTRHPAVSARTVSTCASGRWRASPMQNSVAMPVQRMWRTPRVCTCCCVLVQAAEALTEALLTLVLYGGGDDDDDGGAASSPRPQATAAHVALLVRAGTCVCSADRRSAGQSPAGRNCIVGAHVALVSCTRCAGFLLTLLVLEGVQCIHCET